MPIDPHDVLTKLSEGRLSKLDERIKSYIVEPLPTFTRMIVLDVISDPSIIDDNKIDYWKNVLKVSNSRFAKILPRNSIVAQPANVGKTRITPVMFVFPFFPSHLALPCKPGEMIWTMFEDPNARIKEIAYWFCRIAEPHTIDDVNHTHHAAQLNDSSDDNIKKVMEEGKQITTYELRNGKTQTTKDGVKFTAKDSNTLESKDVEVFEKLITQTDAAALMQYESIPRFRKRPGDVAIEGSNNTLIVLGTDRANTLADYEFIASHPSRGIIPAISRDFRGGAGAIDLVAGRGMTPFTGGNFTTTNRINDDQELKKEIIKDLTTISPTEGDPDFAQDRSRVLISQRTSPDQNFGLKEYLSRQMLSQNIIDSPDGDAAIVIKSDKIRIVARSDISFIVTDYTENKSIDGSDINVKSSELDSSKWASITIRRNGDIIFSPSNKGVIKLGGDDASQAILCTSYVANNNEGIVNASPIATTGGGFIGTFGNNIDSAAAELKQTPDLGTFSTKVLIK